MSQSGIKKDCTNQTPLSGQITAVVHESGAGMSGVWCLEVLCVCRTKDDDTEWMSAQPSIFSLKGPGDWHQLSPSSPVPPPVSPQAYSQQSCVNMDTCKRRVSRIWALIDTFVEFGHFWMECTLKKKRRKEKHFCFWLIWGSRLLLSVTLATSGRFHTVIIRVFSILAPKNNNNQSQLRSHEF